MNFVREQHDSLDGVLPLALGTAQLGMTYGVANRQGRPDKKQALMLIEAFMTAGGRWFDTARAYGESERVLGRCLGELEGGDRARVITKVSENDLRSRESAIRAVEDSHLSLGIRPWAVLLHQEELLAAWYRGVGESMLALKAAGLTAHIGASVYSAEWASRALEIRDLDVLQVPGNIFDRRMLRSGVLEEARRKGVAIFVRSVYLQGLALLDAEKLPAQFGFAVAATRTFSQFCSSHNLARDAFALSYARKRFGGITMVGAETPEQVRRNCSLVRSEAIPDEVLDEWDRVWPDDEESLIDPRWWPRVSEGATG